MGLRQSGHACFTSEKYLDLMQVSQKLLQKIVYVCPQVSEVGSTSVAKQIGHQRRVYGSVIYDVIRIIKYKSLIGVYLTIMALFVLIYFPVLQKIMDGFIGKAQSLWTNLVQNINNDIKLRRMLMPLRTSEMSFKIKEEDKLNIKYTVFASMFVLFNASLLSLYFTFKGKNSNRLIKAPIILGCFSILAYKLQVEWISRQIIRKCELSPSEVAYYTRKMLLQECSESRFVKIRSKILQAKNRQYELIYKME